MTPTSIDSTTITLLQGTTTVLSQINMLNSEVAVIVPSGNLSTYTSYTVTITTDVKCVEGIPLATHYAWNFTTGADSLPLSVVSVSPANTTLNVSPTAGILVTFQKAVDSATLISANITITANGSLFSNGINDYSSWDFCCINFIYYSFGKFYPSYIATNVWN